VCCMAVGNRNTPTKEILIIRKPEPSRIEKRKRAWDLAVVAYSPIENWCPQRPPPSVFFCQSRLTVRKSEINCTAVRAPRRNKISSKPELRKDTNTKTKDKHLCVRGRLTVRLSESTARPSELPG